MAWEPVDSDVVDSSAGQAIVLPDGHRSEFNPASRALTLAVMKKVQDESLPLSVNDCSMQSKIRQLRGRRPHGSDHRFYRRWHREPA